MNKLIWKKQPLCEVCGAEPATSFSWIKKTWKFCGVCTMDYEDYYIEFDRFFNSPAATVDWLAHMDEKKWMDWTAFMAMMARFRKATDSFHQT